MSVCIYFIVAAISTTEIEFLLPRAKSYLSLTTEVAILQWLRPLPDPKTSDQGVAGAGTRLTAPIWLYFHTSQIHGIPIPIIISATSSKIYI
jgi:hypothetical protein